MIIRGRLFNIAQVVVGGGPQKVSSRGLREGFSPGVQRLQHQRVILVFCRNRRQSFIRPGAPGIEPQADKILLLGLGKLSLVHEHVSQHMVKLRVLLVVLEQLPVLPLGFIVFFCLQREIGDFTLRLPVLRGNLQRRLKFGECLIILSTSSQNPSQLHMRGSALRIEFQIAAQALLRLGQALTGNVNIGQACERLDRLRIRFQHLFILFFRPFCIVLALQNLRYGKMQIQVLGVNLFRLLICSQSIIGRVIFQTMAQCVPCGK